MFVFVVGKMRAYVQVERKKPVKSEDPEEWERA